ncbi:hypothetical protein Acsp03_37310 [Actinomadura sp. NBRC 104412]|uniref:class F sortase n=1 Tax=Actinomadura sp. NBRC 104412 TaxID=3032203 RepID=UPI0024A518D7|nr:class F sortase [Actinomadura sp. NBRC 104412]GLZ06265.1 hypothetical protein Acsp03_37310 [Actinomadura sp. NBRC 104412]
MVRYRRGGHLRYLQWGVAAALILGGGCLFVEGLRTSAPPRPPAAVAVATAPAPGPAPTRALPRSAPKRIEIPRIKVRARVTGLGLDRDGTLAVPPLSRVDEAGWYEEGPSPGEPGPAVIVGHVDSRTEAGVFYKLGALRPGALVRVHREDGTGPRFKVYRIESRPKDDFPTDRVYGDTARPEIRLITCGGRFDGDRGHYTENVIVYGYLL